ncbi:hypothetical protein DYH09_18830 [bacterium CPR1]|nr:hypothetical protein [bacterium CPR1]
MLVRVKEPPTEIRLMGKGAAEVLAGLKQLYPDRIVVDSDEEFVDITQTDWYRTRQASSRAQDHQFAELALNVRVVAGGHQGRADQLALTGKMSLGLEGRELFLQTLGETKIHLLLGRLLCLKSRGSPNSLLLAQRLSRRWRPSEGLPSPVRS